MTLRLAQFGAVSAGEGDPSQNWLQYFLPLAVIGVTGLLFFILPGLGIRFGRISRAPLHEKLA